jgi:hypothetical protein
VLTMAIVAQEVPLSNSNAMVRSRDE